MYIMYFFLATFSNHTPCAPEEADKAKPIGMSYPFPFVIF